MSSSYSFSPSPSSLSLSLSPFNFFLPSNQTNPQETNTPLMAVEAHHLHLFPSQQQLIRNRETINTIENQASIYNNTQMAFFDAAGPPSAFTAAGNFIPDVSDSGLTFNDFSVAAAASSALKRPRGLKHPFSFLGEDISSHFQQQQLEMDRILAHHTEKVRLELWERRRRFSRRIAAAVQEGMVKRMKAKEEEIEKMGKLNCALEERIRSLCVENQIWREVAQTNEAAASVLRTNLEQVLAAQVRVSEEPCDPLEVDAESCCDNNHCGGGDDTTVGKGSSRRLCRRCGLREPSVLLLPCRHFCLCTICGPTVSVCPICNCDKNGSVNVNMS